MRFYNALIAFVLFIAGCSSFKASERPVSSFLTHGADMKRMPERYPFQHVWTSEQLTGEQRTHYSKIYIAPVNLKHLDLEHPVWKVRARDVGAHPEDVKEIADYMRERFMQEMRGRPNTVVQVVDEDPKTPDAVRLELAIVELLPTATLAKAAGTAAGILVPGGGLLAADAGGSIAIEGRVIDSATGEVIGEFADREIDKRAPVDLGGLTWYTRSKENINDWAHQFAELANTTPDEKVKDSSPFTLSLF